MKYKDLRERIILARESNAQNLLPWDSYLEKIRTAEAVLDFTEQKKADTEIIQQARWHVVIMHVSAMEIYFKGMVGIFVEGGWINDTFWEILREDKISLADLVDINKEKITIAEIISVSRGFENLDSINRLYSKMLGCDNFVEEVSKFKAPLSGGKHFILKNENPEFRKDIKSLIHFRHLAIHHDIVKRTLSTKSLNKLTASLNDFVYSADFYLMKASDKYTEG